MRQPPARSTCGEVVTVSTEIRAFLDALFGDKPDNLYMLIWTLKNKRSAWFTDLDRAAVYAAAQAAQTDVYVGVSLSQRDYGASARCPAAQAAGIVGLWVDLDIADPVHKKPNLPPSEREALALLDSLGLAPSIVVHSGHGLQAWWLLREPWVFETDQDRDAAAALVQRWQHALKAKAAVQGWDVDSTNDLARVLRLPGTVNHKADPVPVRILQESEARYNPSDFEQYLPEDSSQRRQLPPKRVGNIVLNSNATPPFDKFEALLEIEPKFRATWERKRKDLPDQSPSAYDFALANYAVMAGWADQEIVDLLIAHRRKHSDDLKLRPDYYERTIAKVRETLRRAEAEELLADTLHAVEKEQEATADDAEAGQTDGAVRPNQMHRETLLETLSALLGVEIRRIVKYLSDPPQYRLETARGAIMLGGVEHLIGQAAFRNRVAAVAGVLIPKFKGDKWDQIAQAMLNACEEESLGAEATDAGLCHAWLQAYLSERKPAPEEEWQQALLIQNPFRYNGSVYITGAGLRKWLKLTQGENLNAKSMGAILRAGGCVAEVLGCEVEGKRTTRSVWRLPPQYL